MSDSKQTFQRRNKPVFEETQRWDTSNAIKATNLLIALFEDILSDQYIRVPHSLSAILWQEDKLKIDMERTFDENDPYIKEEALIAPIEHQTDRFWRRKITRLTYLACQFLLGLLTGKLPIHPQILTKEDLISPHTDDQFIILQQFLYKGISEDVARRFQSWEELKSQLQYLNKELFPPLDLSCTEKNLPQYPELMNKYKKMLSKAASSQTSAIPKVTAESYEVFFWIPKFESAYKIVINIPAEVIIGRKSNKDNTMKYATPIDKMRIHKDCQEKDGKYIYEILIEGDSCLSRKHARIVFPEKISEPPFCEDMGSTHGIIMFLDSQRNLTSSKNIVNRNRMEFYCPKDQYLQLGNTSLRIRQLIGAQI